MDRITFAKKATKLVVSHCTGFVVANVLKNNCSVDSKLQKAELYIGAMAIGGVVGAHAEAWTDHKIDWLVDLARQIKAKQDETHS